MVRSCKVASMQGVHTCTDMTLGWSATFALSQTCATLRSATFALSQTCATLELRRFPHMEAQPFALSQTCATLEMGRRFPQTFATLEKGGAFHREAQPSPLSQTFAPPKPAHRRWGRRSGALLHPRRGGRHSGRSAWRGLPLHHEVEFWLSPKSVKNAILWTAKALTKAN
jgi:hypothetical protein